MLRSFHLILTVLMIALWSERVAGIEESPPTKKCAGSFARFIASSRGFIVRKAKNYVGEVRDQGIKRIFLVDRQNPEKRDIWVMLNPLSPQDAIPELGRFRKRLSLPTSFGVSVALWAIIDSYYFAPKALEQQRKLEIEESLDGVFEGYLSQFSLLTPVEAQDLLLAHSASFRRWYSGGFPKGDGLLRFAQLEQLGVLKNRVERERLDELAYQVLKCTRQQWSGSISPECKAKLSGPETGVETLEMPPFGVMLGQNFMTALKADVVFGKKSPREQDLIQFLFLPPVQIGARSDLAVLNVLLSAKDRGSGKLLELAAGLEELGLPRSLEIASRILDDEVGPSRLPRARK